MAALHLTDANFQSEVLNSDVPVLVDFWAEWCGPCKMMTPVVEEVAIEMAGKIKVGKINVDEAQAVASKFGIMSIPTFIIFNGGKVAVQFVGAMPKDHIIEKINSVL